MLDPIKVSIVAPGMSPDGDLLSAGIPAAIVTAYLSARGIVVVDITVDGSGRVANAQVVRSIPELDQAALDAVRGWVFEPTRLNGEPVSLVLTVTVNFTLAR